MIKHILMWSGGYDSTLLLHTLAKKSSSKNPVHAFSILKYPCLGEPQLEKQQEARLNYLKFAKGKGFHIVTESIEVISNIDLRDGGRYQPLLWLISVLPYVEKDYHVHFAYVRGDDFWHHNQQISQVFYDLLRITGLQYPDVQLIYDFEWKRKHQVLEEIKKEGIPKDCFWTCENPVTIKGKIVACGKCVCCRNYKAAL